MNDKKNTIRQIRRLVNEIAAFGELDLPPEQYYPRFLTRIVQALAAVGGAIWVVGEGGRLELAYYINMDRTLLDPSTEDAIRHLQLVRQVVQTGEPRLVAPTSEAGGVVGNPTNCLLILSPIKRENDVESIVEIFQRSDSAPASHRGYLHFVAQMCDLAGNWLRNQNLWQ